MSESSYGILLPSYWDGPTGRSLQARGKDAVILGAFLMANPFANMIGLYELSLKKIATCLPVIKNLRVLRKTLHALEQERYIFYDFRYDFVWVCSMARVRLQLTGAPMLRTDKRRLGAVRLYESLPENPLLGPFFDRYSHELLLPRRRGEGLIFEGASQGASQGGCLTPSITSVHQVPVHQDQGSEDQGSGSAAAAPRLTKPAAEPKTAEQNVELITTLVLHDILPLNLPDSELDDVVKERCARLRIPYNSSVVRRAIESAQFRRHLQNPLFAPPSGVPPRGHA